MKTYLLILLLSLNFSITPAQALPSLPSAKVCGLQVINTMFADDAGKITPKSVAGKAGKFLIYPTMIPSRMLGTIQKSIAESGKVKGLLLAPFRYIKRDGLTAAGYLAFYKGLGGTPLQWAEFYMFPHNTDVQFENETKRPTRHDGLTVFVDGIPTDNALMGAGEYEFKVRYGKQADAYYIKANSIEEMMKGMSELAKKTGKPIAEATLLGHGMPGEMDIGTTTLSAGSSDELIKYHVPFAKDATVRLKSCLVGSKALFGGDGENFMKMIGQSLLPKGGEVLASNSTIYTTSKYFPQQAHKNETPIVDVMTEDALRPLEFAMLGAWSAKNYNQGRTRTVKVGVHAVPKTYDEETAEDEKKQAAEDKKLHEEITESERKIAVYDSTEKADAAKKKKKP